VLPVIGAKHQLLSAGAPSAAAQYDATALDAHQGVVRITDAHVHLLGDERKRFNPARARARPTKRPPRTPGSESSSADIDIDREPFHSNSATRTPAGP